MKFPSRLPSVLAAALCGGIALSGCTPNQPAGTAGGRIQVAASDDACKVATTSAPAGTVRFTVKNEGSKVTEFYLLASDGLRIIGEVENIGPGLSRDLTVTADEGKYFTACKPGMIGDGIRGEFTVTKSEGGPKVSAEDGELKKQATTQYAAYVKDQAEQLMTATEKFAELYRSGKDDEARKSYAPTRMHWERIEPVAEAFGDLDPKLDLREADLKAGQEWTGWHRIEKDLWPPASGYTKLTDAERKKYADQLVADTKVLYDRTRDITFTADQLSNGAKELLDEVATGKVTGEEEAWSHTDLWDFQANVEGAKIAWEVLRPLLKKRDAELDATLAKRFAAVEEALNKHRVGDGFKLYTQLSKEEIKTLADAVNGLGEPLGKLTEKVVE